MVRCIDAWTDLSTERPIGFAVGAIPWSRIVAWCEFEGLDREATKIMVHVIRRLDIERAESAAADQAKNKATGKGKR